MIGTSAVMIFDEDDCVVRAVAEVDGVLRARVVRQVHAVPRGQLLDGADPRADPSTAQGTDEDLDTLLDTCDNILGRSFCALGDGATSPVTSSIKYFRDDYLAYVDRHCALPARPVPASSAGATDMTVAPRSGRPAPRTWSPSPSTASRSPCPRARC